MITVFGNMEKEDIMESSVEYIYGSTVEDIHESAIEDIHYSTLGGIQDRAVEDIYLGVFVKPF